MGRQIFKINILSFFLLLKDDKEQAIAINPM
nr:MAG TPA: hypothetical protein [Caudoviricetes sp.]